MVKKKEIKLIKWDLACGDRKQEGFRGVDIVKTSSTDYIYDLTKTPWPFVKKESVDEYYSSHFFEHLTGKQRMDFMDEIYRTLKVGCKVVIICPYYSSMRAVQDPTHQWPPVCEASFLYFNKGWRDQNKLSHYPIKSDFDFSYGYQLNPNWGSRNEEVKQFAIGQYINVVSDIFVTLIKR